MQTKRLTKLRNLNVKGSEKDSITLHNGNVNHMTRQQYTTTRITKRLQQPNEKAGYKPHPIKLIFKIERKCYENLHEKANQS